MTADPYPTNLGDIDDEPTPSLDFERQLLVALNRIAIALERGIQPVQNGPQRPQPTLQALPPVQQVESRPACPYHGPDKVRTSDKGPGFYCAAKGGPATNARGFCTWHS